MAGKFKFDWDALKENIQKEEAKKKGFEKDTRFWSPDKKAETGLYIIRFLPDSNGTPFVKMYSHSFDYMQDGNKKWWIKNCPTTLGYDHECPICKKNTEYWNSAYESDKAIASKRKRKLQYISNILVVKDPNNEENNGKVFLYSYGTKIYEKIAARMFPSDTDKDDPDFQEFIPFDLYEGADFKLKIKRQGEFPNYDDSSFSSVKALGDDKKIDKIMSMVHDLSEFTKESNFPTKEETIKVLGKLLAIAEPDEVDADDEPAPPVRESKKAEKKKTVEQPQHLEDDEPTDLTDIDDETDSSDSSDETDDDMKFFESLK